MFLVLLVWAAYIYGGIQVIFHGFRIHSFLVTVGIAAVLFIVLMYWSIHHLTRVPKITRPVQQAAPQPASAPQPADDSNGIRKLQFKVAGVTFDNEDGSSRQEILRHLKFLDEPYVDEVGDYLVSIDETTYDGEPALEVRINDYQVGWVPKTMIKKVQKAMQDVASFSADAEISGGGIDETGKRYPYGCTITATYLE